jgi:hypothetical protein
MPDEYEPLLERLSKEMALKRSDIVRMALKHFFEEHQESPAQTPFQKVRHLLGVADSGVKDLGKNHRAYLIKKIMIFQWIMRTPPWYVWPKTYPFRE